MTFLNYFLIFSLDHQKAKQLNNWKRMLPFLWKIKIYNNLYLKLRAKALNLTTIHLTNNRHMINGLINALKSINTTGYHSKIEIQRLNYAHNFFLTLADIDH